ncbi:MAG TPA: GTPase ObgE [Verrucomicrobiota bacterium]|jgi:GTP-binding protein|nr:GTPase ObgE [Verrucomicrobiota bacterium]OQC23345.1 MAG: GTPase Obg [Verrucomicrobia bacterium ADurb.Bin063]HCL92880.1 GTPase ObgE [Limisphaerales bacterium]HRR64204.1 GTPase ObgE [Candidatus Paceibacterota bacterium]MBP8013979.1 GTPase ObgE [Verrucomicrobiota bacterium]
MFIDEIKVYARAGHGGKGCVAFQREKFRPKGGPSGGNGGRGGDVILEADHDLNNLIAQFYQPRLLAADGEPGLGKGMDGRAGRDLVVKVPCGTLVWRLDAAADGEISRTSARREYQSQSRRRRMLRTLPGEADADGEEAALPVSVPAAGGLASGPESRGELVIDLVEPGQRFVLCQGGRGGLGNRNFATAVRQTPRFAQPGEPGGEGNFLLELRIMAEVGLVGYPNAGKSTLLTAISRARPKIAPYPFTTLHPQIGIVEYPDYHRLTVCDVPGLIEGAHRNVGLGHEFLRHIERCKVLVLLLDMAGTDGRAPWDDYRSLLRELELYDPALVEKPRLIVANKMDEAAARENLKAFKCRIRRVSILSMAAAFGEGLAEFKQAIRAAAG